MANSTVRTALRTWPLSRVAAIPVVLGLGCIWGLAESTLGPALRSAQVPLSGPVMVLIGICCALSARRLCPGRGVVMAAGVAAASVRLCALGPVLPVPAIAILCEAAVMELLLMLLGGNALGFAVAGAAAAVYPALHAFVFKTLFFGLPMAVAYSALCGQVRDALRLTLTWGPGLILIGAAVCAAAGAAAALAIYGIFRPVKAWQMTSDK